MIKGDNGYDYRTVGIKNRILRMMYPGHEIGSFTPSHCGAWGR